ncbi:hypothetical protein HK100_000736 [Physocladia obscura]|uniref:Arylsulfatase n=1 Tax=Physocladia obscura TaxID=109957 RepID=A0AAD5T9E9_9FUNG|nr:hypothetical protein HK100_000736 [Physocladia obscura]
MMRIVLLLGISFITSVNAGACFSGPLPFFNSETNNQITANSSYPIGSNIRVETAAPYSESKTQVETSDSPKRPNIIFILTDDQDVHMDSLEYMPFVKKHLIDKGTLFKNHFTTTAICCPSRVSLLKGQFAHNTKFVDVHGEHGGYDKFLREGLNNEYLPKWLQSAGYATYYVGKFLNGYAIPNYDQTPGGWNVFDTLVHPYVYDNFHPVFARNGEKINDYEGTFQVDVIQDKDAVLNYLWTALEILGDALGPAKDEQKPFFLYLAPTAPHTEILFPKNGGADGKPYVKVQMTQAIPAKRHANLFPDAQVPRRKNFNTADVSGKPGYIAQLPLLDEKEIENLDHWYRQRLRSLQAVDELVDSVVKAVEEAGQSDNTYIFYSSDNGYHLGLHRLNAGKTTPYEDDVNIPLIVRGPGVAHGAVRKDSSSTHTDIAPTFVKIAGAANEAYEFDGTPIPIHSEEVEDANRESFAVEFWRPYESETFQIPNIEENIYRSVRVVGKDYSYLYTVWCTGHRELYNHKTDPEQITNIYKEASVSLINRLDALLVALKDCIGSQCSHPWNSLHLDGDVKNLGEALNSKFDEFYQSTGRLEIKECLRGFYPENESVRPALKQ